MDDVYVRLAEHLDNLPAGFPRTESGVELRILRRLFSPDDAELALHLTLLPEDARVIALRAGMPAESAAQSLEEMHQKGLIFCLVRHNRPPRYGAQQFVVGIWENQVNHLSLELVQDFEEYQATLAAPERWRTTPQLRTIPVSESITDQTEVLPYERAAELVRNQSFAAVANCICRQEMHLLGQGCDKPIESCLTFGIAAQHYVKGGRGRAVSTEEALAILSRAEAAGLVLQAGNDQHSLNICTCCGCCCGVLRNMKRDPKPARIAASPFFARLESDLCEGCGRCEARCPMEAVWLEGDRSILDVDRCIGCGLCVSVCPSGALTLVRKPPAQQPHVPVDAVHASIEWAHERGKLPYGEALGTLARSGIDRFRARFQTPDKKG